jgi:soluble lytic murein transglycosylase-like protein
VGLICWLCSVTIILFIFAPYLYGSREGTETVVIESVAPERPTASKSDALPEIMLMLPKPEPALTRMLHESTLARSTPSSCENPPALAPESTPVSIPVSKDEGLFHPIILEAADRYEVDLALIKAIIMVESSYNPNAISRRGARGLMQLMPKTAEALGVGDSFNPEHNIKAGVRHFKNLLDQFDGDIKLALAAYNAGSRKVRKYNGIPPFKATHRYIKRVFEYREYYKNQTAW